MSSFSLWGSARTLWASLIRLIVLVELPRRPILRTLLLRFSLLICLPGRAYIGPQKAAKNQKPHQSGVPGARLVALRPSRAQQWPYACQGTRVWPARRRGRQKTSTPQRSIQISYLGRKNGFRMAPMRLYASRFTLGGQLDNFTSNLCGS